MRSLPPSRSAVAPRRAALLTLVALLGAAPGAVGQLESPFPIPMRIEGFVGPKPAEVKSLARWVVATDGAQYTFHVTKLVPLGVDVAYWDILNKLEPLPITLTLYGDPQLVRQFTDAPAGVPIAIMGNFELGPGPVTLLLATVQTLPEPSIP